MIIWDILDLNIDFIESYLVCNDKDSNTGKSKDAKALNVPIITEEEYIQKFLGQK